MVLSHACELMESLTPIHLGNFFPFGEAAGDFELPRVNDTSSPPQVMPNFVWPFFGKNEDTFFVSQTVNLNSLCLCSP